MPLFVLTCIDKPDALQVRMGAREAHLAYVRERMKDPHDPLKARAARVGLTLVHRERIPSTRRAHEAAEFARAHGQLEPFHAAEKPPSQWRLGAEAEKIGVDPDTGAVVAYRFSPTGPANPSGRPLL